jgi:hypothetical protein
MAERVIDEYIVVGGDACPDGWRPPVGNMMEAANLFSIMQRVPAYMVAVYEDGRHEVVFDTERDGNF